MQISIQYINMHVTCLQCIVIPKKYYTYFVVVENVDCKLESAICVSYYVYFEIYDIYDL